MRMKKSNLLWVAATAALFASCESEQQSMPESNPVKAEITARIAPVLTRAYGTSWEANDIIGVSGTSGETVYENITYQTDGSGAFSVVPPAEAIYYQSSEAVKFTAYYPYSDTDEITADTRNQASQNKFDYLYAEATGSKTSPNVNFQFEHKMSQLVLNIIAGNGITFENIKDGICSLKSHYYTGTFDRTTGTATCDGTPSEQWVFLNSSEAGYNVTPDDDAANSTRTARLIFFPQKVENGATFSITIDGQSFEANVHTKDQTYLELAAGYKYIYNITVNKTDLSISEATIADWQPGNGDNGDDVEATM